MGLSGRVRGRSYDATIIDDPILPTMPSPREIEKRARAGEAYRASPTKMAELNLAQAEARVVESYDRRWVESAQSNLTFARGMVEAVSCILAELSGKINKAENQLQRALKETPRDDREPY